MRWRSWAPSGAVGFLLLLGALFLSLDLVPGVATGPAGDLHREFVGTPAADPGATAACAEECRVREVFAQWQAEHPHATIVESVSLFSEGRLIGYDLTYLE